jgi:hypothetical protein
VKPGRSSGFAQDDLEQMGNNQLQGNDQENVHNQRETMPEESDRTEGVVESAKSGKRAAHRPEELRKG